ncbi:hypothetical protein BDW02DRAFT_155016 [Decorospora gaudefroyi]|uniref:Mid2 domain-containing protein n=1 Tax=Decorospora gaudefroyi TaxID=184978 RepID=A0A6A5KZY7_9PLEO|nr:hypothetical protein BDW02DRAFT_155016 [Decorospora gaudefroyi]
MVARLSLLSVFATVVAAAATSQKCYGVDGTALNGTYTPCNPSAKHSACCASSDICLSNGLCMATTGASIGQLFQSGCTDKSGKDTACPQKMCPGASDDFDDDLTPVSSWQLQTCDYGKYCCRATTDTRSCCNNASAPKLTTTFSATLQLQTSTPTASPSSEPTNIAGPAVAILPTPTTTTDNDNSCQQEKRQTAIVGGTIGSLFGSIILGLSATILWMYKREKKQRRLKEHYEEQFSQTNAYRKALASSAGSPRGSLSLEEFGVKGVDVD